jgi:hypothetical protein
MRTNIDMPSMKYLVNERTDDQGNSASECAEGRPFALPRGFLLDNPLLVAASPHFVHSSVRHMPGPDIEPTDICRATITLEPD